MMVSLSFFFKKKGMKMLTLQILFSNILFLCIKNKSVENPHELGLKMRQNKAKINKSFLIKA